MSALAAAVGVEVLKARRSRVPWLVGVGLSMAPLIVGLFMVILKDPESARKMGLLGAKAQLAGGTADWPAMLLMLAQAVVIGGSVLLAFLTSWVYGREFCDRTVRGLLAIPTSRTAIVTAKAIVVSLWGAAILVWVTALGFVVGFVVGLPGWSPSIALDAAARMAVAGVLVLALQPVTALMASLGRGYIAGLAWAVLTVAASQVLAVLGWGDGVPVGGPRARFRHGGPRSGRGAAGQPVARNGHGCRRPRRPGSVVAAGGSVGLIGGERRVRFPPFGRDHASSKLDWLRVLQAPAVGRGGTRGTMRPWTRRGSIFLPAP